MNGPYNYIRSDATENHAFFLFSYIIFLLRPNLNAGNLKEQVLSITVTRTVLLDSQNCGFYNLFFQKFGCKNIFSSTVWVLKHLQHPKQRGHLNCNQFLCHCILDLESLSQWSIYTIQQKITILGVTAAYYLSFLNFQT